MQIPAYPSLTDTSQFWVDPATVKRAPADQPSLIGGGLAAGLRTLGGLGGAAVGAIGGAIGHEPLQQWGAETYRSQMQRAAEVGRPEYDVNPLDVNLTDLPAYGVYQIAKQLPQLAAVGAGMAAGGALLPGAVPAGVASIAARLPAFLGGAGLRAGAGEAAIQAAGQTAAKGFAGAVVPGAAIGAGSMYGEAVERGDAGGGAPTQGDALKALGLAPAYGALEAVSPLGLTSIAKTGVEGAGKSVMKRMAQSAGAAAANEAVVEAAQTAMEQFPFRPDRSLGDQARDIVGAAIAGGIVGGGFGGAAGGFHELQNRLVTQKPAAEVTDQDLGQVVDQVLALPPPARDLDIAVGHGPNAPQLRLPAPMTFVDSEGRAAPSLQGVEQLAQQEAENEQFVQTLLRMQEASEGTRAAGAKYADQEAYKAAMAANLANASAPALPPPADFYAGGGGNQVVSPDREVAFQQSDLNTAPQVDESGQITFPSRFFASGRGEAPAQARTQTMDSGDQQIAQSEQLALDTRPPAQIAADKRVAMAAKLKEIDPTAKTQAIALFDNGGATQEDHQLLARALYVLNTSSSPTNVATAEKIAAHYGLGEIGNIRSLEQGIEATAAQAQAAIAARDEALARGDRAAAKAAIDQADAAVARLEMYQQAQELVANPQLAREQAQAAKTQAKAWEALDKAQAELQAAKAAGNMQAIRAAQQNLNTVAQTLQTKAAEPPRSSQTSQPAVAETPAAPVASFGPVNPVMQAKLQEALQRQAQAEIPAPPVPASARVPSQRQLAQQRQQEQLARRAQQAVTEPIQIEPVTAANPALRGQARLVAERINQLDAEQQARIFDREEFQGSGDPVAAVHSWIAGATTAPRMAAVRSQLAEIAGVDPSFFTQAALKSGRASRAARPAAVTAPTQKGATPAEISDRLGPALTRVAKPDAKSPDWAKHVDKVVSRLSAHLGIERPQLLLGDSVEGRKVRGAAMEREHALVLNRGLSRVEALQTALHELGHLAQFRLLENANKETQTAILHDFNELQKDNPNVSFEEWFADQVAHWLSTHERPVGVVQKFFQRIADLWKQIHKLLTADSRTEVSPEVEKFMRGQWREDVREARAAQAPSTTIGNRVYLQEDETTAPGMNNIVQRFAQQASKALRQVLNGEVSALATTTHLYVSTVNHIKEQFGKYFPSGSLNKLPKAQELRNAAEQKLSQLCMQPMLAHERLDIAHPKAADMIRKLMLWPTGFRIDPRKGWDAHTWLHKSPDEAMLRRKVAEANTLYNNLKRVAGKDFGLDFNPVKVYHDFIAVNQSINYMQQVARLYNFIIADSTLSEQIPATKDNPLLMYMSQPALNENPVEAVKFWKAQLDKLYNQADALVKAEVAKHGKGSKDKLRGSIIGDLKAQLLQTDRIKAATLQAPYFHLGRKGDYFVSFKLRADNGMLAQYQDHVADELRRNGYDGVEIPVGAKASTVFIRVETQGDAQKLVDLAKTFNQKGWLDNKSGEPITHGKRAMEADRENDVRILEKAIQQLYADVFAGDELGLSPEDTDKLNLAQQRVLDQLKSNAIDMLPDTSMMKMLVSRKFVGGYTTDALWSYANRTKIAAHGVANMFASPMVREAFVGMRSDINAAKKQNDVSRTTTMQRVFSELSIRESNRVGSHANTIVDTIRAVNHAYFLGMSPSYGLVQLTQLGALLWPELAKNKGGHVKAAKVIAKVTPDAFKAMKEVFGDAMASGAKRIPDINISAEALIRAFGDTPAGKAKANLIMNMVTRGVIDLGSASRELGRVVQGNENSKMNLGLRYASMVGLYSETFTRITAALAAAEMHGGTGQQMEAYVEKVVRESMLNYTSDNIGRAFGRQGVAGALTPIGTSFMQYNFQVLEKLYREIGTAFSKSTSAEERAASRRFLGAHLAGMLVLAGSLGLPFASVVARGIESLKDLLDDDDQPYDVKAAWRNLLADTFGKDVGEVLSRGLPRAFGFDISGRVGEQDILPFSKFLTDRRSWEDALKELAWRTTGAPSSMLANVLEGGSEIAKGNLIKGMAAGMPLAMRGPVKAFQMTNDGYVDNNGRGMPLTPGAWDIMVQALGFTPSDKAEYNEAKYAETQRKAGISSTASNIRNNVVEALLSGDAGSYQTWAERAQQFDANNPAYAVMRGAASAARSQMKERALSETTRTPVGTNMKDPGAITLPRFANW